MAIVINFFFITWLLVNISFVSNMKSIDAILSVISGYLIFILKVGFYD